MDTLTLPSPACGRPLVLVSPESALVPLFDLVGRMALQEPLYVLDGGNTFQGYPLARVLRRRERSADLSVPLRRVLLSRAFTCYQMAALLEETDFEVRPVFVLDFLASFYDQGVRITDRRRLLRGCIRKLQALSQQSLVVIWVRQRSVVPQEALGFVDIVKNAAGQVWYPPRPPALPVLQQGKLF